MVSVLPEAADEPLPPVVSTEPTADDGTDNGDAVELVRTGMVRFRIGDKTWRLRRPFFGELKALRTQWQDIVDEVGDEAIRAGAVAQDNVDAYEALQTDEQLTHTQKAERTLELRRADRATGRAMTERGEELRMAWWASCFEALSVEHPVKMPEDLPGWFSNGTLPRTVLDHWRSVPLGRG